MAKIRLMTSHDLELIIKIQTCFFDSGKFYSFNTLTEMLANKDMQLLVLTDGEEIIGYAICYLLVDHVDLLQIAIDRKFQKRGHGKELLNEIEKFKKDVFVEVNEENQNAIGFYEHVGFKKQSILKQYYGGCDAFLLKKEIQ